MNAQTDPPNQTAANKIMRVLSGNPLKYTVRVHKADGSVIEWQSDTKPKLNYENEARALFLADGEYGSNPIMEWEDDMIILTEENPK